MCYVPDPRSGRPIANGSIYIGVVDEDPTIEANRKTVYLIKEDGSTVTVAAASQPLKTSAGGVISGYGIVDTGPVQVETDDAYSITIQDSLAVTVCYFPSVVDQLSITEPFLQSANFYTNDASSVSNAYVVIPPASPLPDELLDNEIIVWRPSDNSSMASTLSVMLSGGPSTPKQYFLPDGVNPATNDYLKTSRDYMCRWNVAADGFIDIDLGLFSYNPSIQVWNADVDYYTVPSYVTGSDSLLYKSISQTGPNLGGSFDPVGDAGVHWKLIQESTSGSLAFVNNFRLSLFTSSPVTTTDVVGATNIYMVPYTGTHIGLYSGSSWVDYSTNQITLALGTITNNQGYDVFCYPNSGVPALEILAWTSNTARATALVYQDGVLCKSGDTTRRYLGSFLSTSTTTTEDSVANRYLFNYYNRIMRYQTRSDATATWSYNNATVRQANGSTSNQLNFFTGVVEDSVHYALTANSKSGVSTTAINGIGLNSITAYTNGTAYSSGATNDYLSNTVSGDIIPILGKNYISWLESTSGAVTFTGTDGNSISFLSLCGMR